ncbi:MAG: alpha/beta fold hydrolase [Chitinivibrionales bacterium]|nr:alpha/beta fold hydrolase [Chitinivibrionales bacterium]MBD3357875.1 alpha/beta fold hydrolase [Chitinivibrionales bacterium]
MSLLFRIVFFLLQAGAVFVPEEEYNEKVRSIQTLDEKNEGFDLNGWEYHHLIEPASGFVHRYYRHQSKEPDAPVMLFFHGMNLDGRTFLYLDELAEKWELIAYDLPETTLRYTGHYDDFMDITNEFIDLLDREICMVCGVSFGGGIAVRLAASRKDLDIKHLILISTMPSSVTEKERNRNHSVAAWLRTIPDYKLYWLMETLTGLAKRNFEDSKEKRRDVAEVMRMKHMDFYRQISESIWRYSGGAYARQVKCPTLILVGTDDQVVKPDAAREYLRFIPHARFETIEDGTHAMTYQRGEEIAERIFGFCTETHEKPLHPAHSKAP